MQGSMGEAFALRDPAEVAALAAAFVAAICLILNLIVFRRVSKALRDRLQVERETALLRWSDEAIAALAEAERLCAQKLDLFKPDEFLLRQSDAVTGLSSLLDRGQFYFPNADSDRYSNRRASAEPGHKQDAMEALFQAYLTLRNIDPNEKGPALAAAAQRLFEHRKMFVEEVFGGIDSRRRRPAGASFDRMKRPEAPAVRRRAELRGSPQAAA
jgi:hypothetical protein